MEKEEKMKIAREKNKPKLLFACKNYTIEKIPLNYRIMIKCAKKNQKQGMDRDSYTPLEFGIKHAHEVAEQEIARFFTKDLMPHSPFKKK